MPQRFIDNGFWVFDGIKEEIEYGITQFNQLRETIKIDKWAFG